MFDVQALVDRIAAERKRFYKDFNLLFSCTPAVKIITEQDGYELLGFYEKKIKTKGGFFVIAYYLKNGDEDQAVYTFIYKFIYKKGWKKNINNDGVINGPIGDFTKEKIIKISLEESREILYQFGKIQFPETGGIQDNE